MSGNQNWRTPPELFALLDAEFRFTLDGAAGAYDHLVDAWLEGPCVAGIVGSWTRKPKPCSCALHTLAVDHDVFCNPPYETLSPWIETFARWRDVGRSTVVAVLPSKTDTDWYVRAEETANEIRRLTGRVQFIDPATGKPHGRNNYGTSIFIWRPGPRPPLAFTWTWDWRRENWRETYGRETS